MSLYASLLPTTNQGLLSNGQNPPRSLWNGFGMRIGKSNAGHYTSKYKEVDSENIVTLNTLLLLSNPQVNIKPVCIKQAKQPATDSQTSRPNLRSPHPGPNPHSPQVYTGLAPTCSQSPAWTEKGQSSASSAKWPRALQGPPTFCGRVSVATENATGAVTPRRHMDGNGVRMVVVICPRYLYYPAAGLSDHATCSSDRFEWHCRC